MKKISKDEAEAVRRSQHQRPGSSMERAFFEGGNMPYIVVVGAIVIFGIELTANAARGEGMVSILHFVIVGTLEVALVAFLIRNLYRRISVRLALRRETRERSAV